MTENLRRKFHKPMDYHWRFLDQKLADIARRFRHQISTLIRLSPKV
jgi:hypothetical protein